MFISVKNVMQCQGIEYFEKLHKREQERLETKKRELEHGVNAGRTVGMMIGDKVIGEGG